MLNYKTAIVRNGMTDAEIFDLVNKEEAPLIFDARTGVISKTIDEILRSEYTKRQKELENEQKQKAQLAKNGLQTTTLPDAKHRPNAIEIGIK